MNENLLKRVLSPINRRIKLLITRGLVHLIDANAAAQALQVQLYKGETLDNIEHLEPYGYTAHPHPGAECLALSKDGRRAHTIIIAVADRRYRLTGLAEGEVALYDDQGQKVHIKRDGIYIASAQQVVVDTPQAAFTGDVAIDGQLYVTGDIDSDGNISDANGSMQEMRDTYNAHTHPGVQSGSASTAPPGSQMT